MQSTPAISLCTAAFSISAPASSNASARMVLSTRSPIRQGPATSAAAMATYRALGARGFSMAETNFDVIIIGSGPGGYVCAIRAAQLGFKTAIVERDYLGGICLNWGCIPTKALLRSAEIFHYLQHAKDYGLSAGEVTYDPTAVVKRSRAVSKRLNDGVGFLMRKNKVTVIW